MGWTVAAVSLRRSRWEHALAGVGARLAGMAFVVAIGEPVGRQS